MTQDYKARVCHQGPAQEGHREGSTSAPTKHPYYSVKLEKVWEQLPSREDAVMLWGATCLCFFGFQRTREVVVPSDVGYDPQVHLNFQDVKVDNRQNSKWLEVHLKASKTDLLRHGVMIYI